MFKRILTIALLLTGSVAVQAQTTVTVAVDDNTSLADSYINGVGGHYAGADALRNAITAVNADPTTPALFVVNLMDTDGAASTFNGEVAINKPDTTVRQIKNPALNNADTTITVTTITPSGTGGIFSIGAAAHNFRLQGLASGPRLVLNNLAAAANEDASVRAGNTATSNILIENILFTGASPMYERTKDSNWNNCVFRSNSRFPFYTHAGGTNNFTDCVWEPINATPYVFNSVGKHVFTRCTFKLLAGINDNNRHMDVTYTDCTFVMNGGSYSYINVGDVANGAQITLNNPTFAGTPNTAPFMTPDADATTITITGKSALQKTDLSGARAGKGNSMVRMRNGGLVLTNVITDDGMNLVSGTGSTVIVRIDKSIIKAPIAVSADAQAVTRLITATNTMFEVDGTTNSLGLNSGDGNSVANLTHCTFYGTGNAGSAFIASDAFSKVNARFCIFDASKGVTQVAQGGIFTGASSIMAGVFGGTSNAIDPLGTVAPLLDANGRLLVDSNGIGQAAGSNLTEDIDGEARPAGGQLFADLGADEVALVPVELSTFSVE